MSKFTLHIDLWGLASTFEKRGEKYQSHLSEISAVTLNALSILHYLQIGHNLSADFQCRQLACEAM